MMPKLVVLRVDSASFWIMENREDGSCKVIRSFRDEQGYSARGLVAQATHTPEQHRTPTQQLLVDCVPVGRG